MNLNLNGQQINRIVNSIEKNVNANISIMLKANSRSDK